MLKRQKDSAKVADLIIFCNDKDSQQYLVFDLKYGENIIGKNSAKCSIVFRFTSEIDEINTKICIDDDDYTIEDLGSQKGTFKIKSDNSLIRLKAFKSYDLSNGQSFYIGKYKCMFQIVKPGRGMAFSLSPSDLLNSQKNTNNAVNNSKKGIKKTQSIEDDIEDYTGLGSKTVAVGQKKGQQITSLSSKRYLNNKVEPEHIEEEEEENHFYQVKATNRQQNSSIGAQVKKAVNSQKSFVKSKGQMSKGVKGTFKDPSDNSQLEIPQKNDDNDSFDLLDIIKQRKVSDNDDDEDEESEFQFSFPKSFKKSVNHIEEKAPSNRRRTTVNKKNSLEPQVEQKEEEQMKLDSQFLKRIQEKLKNYQQNEQRHVLNDLANKYSSQKRNSQHTQQKSQDIPYDSDDKALALLEKKESENYWEPNNLKRGRTAAIESSLDSLKVNQKSKTASSTSNKVESDKSVPIQKNGKNDKVQQQETKEKNTKQISNESSKASETNQQSKKNQKIEKKNEEKLEKLKQSTSTVTEINKISSKQIAPKQTEKQVKQVEKSYKLTKEKTKNNQKGKQQDDSTSVSNDKSDNDDNYSIEGDEEEEEYASSQKYVNSISTRKRHADQLLTQSKDLKSLFKPTKAKNTSSKLDLQEKKQSISDKTKGEKTQLQKKDEPTKQNKKIQKNELKQSSTPLKTNTNNKKTDIFDIKIEEGEEEEESQKIKTPISKKQKTDVKSNLNSKEKEEKNILSTPRRSVRKNQVEEMEVEEKETKKSTVKSTVAKKNKKQSLSKESVENSDNEEMEIEETKSTRQSTRKFAVKDAQEKQEKKPSKLKTKKEEREQQETETNKKINKKKALKVKNPIRRTKGSKKEVEQLQQAAGSFMDIPRRNKFRIMFSNSSTTEDEKRQMTQYGAKILNDFQNPNDFNILVTDEFKRRLKTLVALNKGYPIVSHNWIKECIKEDKLVAYEPHIINKVDKALAKQHNFSFKKSIQNQKNHPEGILSSLRFVCQASFENISKEEVRKLVESAGGIFQYDISSAGSVYCLSDASKQGYNEQLNDENQIALDIEGLFQACLLQYNVLDDYIIVATTDHAKKSTNKKKK